VTEPALVDRTFQPSDVEPIVALWNESAWPDPTTVPWFTRSVLLDPDFDPGGLLVSEREGRIVGCCYAASRGPAAMPGSAEGWIVFLFVAPDCRRQGLAASLLNRALRLLAERDCGTIQFACMTPHYILPGLDEAAYPGGRELLTGAGFRQHGEVVAMSAGLLDRPPDWPVRGEHACSVGRGGLREDVERLMAAGYRFGPPTDGELPQLIKLAATFSQDWADALRELLTRQHDVRPVMTVQRGGQVLGFASYGAYRGVRERFGPFGVDPAARGLGLGRLLLHETLASMRAAGLYNAWFLWTEQDSAAARLYQQAGFAISRRFSLWQRAL
jgi:ribosomal protein S18 acetylase RimI-like enzyme